MDRRGVRPGELAKAQGVSPGTVSRWRAGECPDDLRFPALAGYLRVPEEWLKTGAGELEEWERGNPQIPRSPGRRREDLELRAAGHGKDAARLERLITLMQVYRDAGRAVTPEILAEWIQIVAENGP